MRQRLVIGFVGHPALRARSFDGGGVARAVQDANRLDQREFGSLQFPKQLDLDLFLLVFPAILACFLCATNISID